ncbi:hypothetical protein DNTS_029696 [Danionella cerebrum]|uniref:C2H2-type domain-containing protein n=1 Tax=Danionella cerebrum TaxID=2873325 RepID=A0A553RC59_9TELE|nr:hypothetical protein DNTS_029696 [Danionella translucida]
MVHSHAQMCTLPPVPQSTNVKKTTDCDQSAQATGNRETEEEFGPFLSLKYTCEGGHHFLWTPINRDKDAASGKECDVTLSGTKGRCQRNVKKRVTLEHQEGKDSSADFSDLEHGQEEAAVLNLTIRGNQRSSEPVEAHVIDHSAGILQNSSHGLEKKDAQIGGKRKRKPMSKVILPCEFEGCGKVFSSRQYLNHHVKFQHVQQKTFTCSHPSCSKAFNFKKHLKEHEKLHSNQRDFICEFCARAFRTSSNLIIHRRIHTGEKPLQYGCEVCGFTCRQKASLNWHMRKHNTESTYQFPCEICGRRFEKRDNLTAHCSKSHT